MKIKYKPVKEAYRNFDKFRLDYNMSPIDNVKRYAEWRALVNKNKLYPTEFLLPQIIKNIKITEFTFMLDSEWADKEVSPEEIKNMGPWNYYIRFPNNLDTNISSSTFTESTIVFHRYRSHLILGVVEDLLGDRLKESSVLDLGCNCGVFTLDMAYRGAKYAVGVDSRKKNIEQANFLKKIFNIKNVDFYVKDVYSLEDNEYDVILCMGLMYHLTDLYSVLKFVYRNTKYFAIIDTICHKEPLSALIVVCNKNVNSPVEGEESLEFTPTYRAMIDMIKESGFKEVVELIGVPDSYVDMYSEYNIRTFICFKEEGLFLLERIKKENILKTTYYDILNRITKYRETLF